MAMQHDKIIILDFGSQTTQLIARRIREQKVYCEIHPFSAPLDKIRAMRPKGLILSGGPCSVYDDDAPYSDSGIFDLGIPVLGICYGAQLMVRQLGGLVEKAEKREFGRADLKIAEAADIFGSLSTREPHQVWMSHGDRIERLPDDFITIAESLHSPYATVRHKTRPFIGVQFHPEVAHTLIGMDILKNFIFQVCGCQPTWTMRSFIER
ncbi:MAG TPA: GMP synthase (glutamine-hydrolyzing), partial [Desulfobulbaceae bacterium]|nr:GMP synthase (glutamine-hydrolyzing) [Desulfobulbaceae bacterium]